MILTLESSRRPQPARLRYRVDGVEWTGPACGGRSARQQWRPCSVRACGAAPKRWNPRSAQAYRNNPTLNAQRAALRATDETVPQALANYRPRVQGSFDAGYQHFESISTSGGAFTQTNTNISPRGGNIGLVQPLFNGQRSGNLTRQAEASVLAGRETLRNTEQDRAARCRDRRT